jgi:hypothetical protein
MSDEKALLLDSVTPSNGNLLRVWNKGRKTRAKNYYWFTYVQFPDGTEMPLMLTEHELDRAKIRARKNTEDCPEKSWLVDLLD